MSSENGKGLPLGCLFRADGHLEASGEAEFPHGGIYSPLRGIDSDPIIPSMSTLDRLPHPIP